jgi:hypothetical protein
VFTGGLWGCGSGAGVYGGGGSSTGDGAAPEASADSEVGASETGAAGAGFRGAGRSGRTILRAGRFGAGSSRSVPSDTVEAFAGTGAGSERSSSPIAFPATKKAAKTASVARAL